MPLISPPASRVWACRRRKTSRHDLDSPIKSFPSWWCEVGTGYFFGGFENSVIETYVDFPFQYTLSKSYQVPNAPVTFDNGSIGTLETGTTGLPLTPGAAQPGAVSFTGEDYT